MPVINVQLTEVSFEKKKELVETLTKTVSEITSIPTEYFTILIEEFKPENIGFAGQTIYDRNCIK